MQKTSVADKTAISAASLPKLYINILFDLIIFHTLKNLECKTVRVF